jgi:hypothetical protein
MTTEEQIAQWMLETFTANGVLYQSDVVAEIRDRFGEQFLYETPSGGDGIARKVRTAFTKLTEDAVLWLNDPKCWVPKRGLGRPGSRVP